MELVARIIPYQAITGNNNFDEADWNALKIIPYQAITGNNNDNREILKIWRLYHTKR